jgi:hypothetical protein
MTLSYQSKLKNLLTTWPQGTICLASYLKSKGIGYDLQMQYRESGWITTLGHGAVFKTGDNINWRGGLYALQSQGKMKVHAGAKTALALSGLAHFLSLANERIHLFASPNSKLPGWFLNFNWGCKIVFHQSSLFPPECKIGLQALNEKTYAIQISSPERAFLELLDLVPQKEGFEEALLISEGLTTLRPKVVQELLEKCSSVKVKRLFLFLSERQNHSWINKLNLKTIDLGKGDRQLIKGGILDPKYRITIPESLK